LTIDADIDGLRGVVKNRTQLTRRVRVRHVSRNRTRVEVAELIERFLENRPAYPQEWNDFVECRQRDPTMEAYRRRCYNLDPLVNRPEPVDENAIAELRGILCELRTARPE
jgi:hypothetical protein